MTRRKQIIENSLVVVGFYLAFFLAFGWGLR
ncbi:hypothetical protein ABIB87_008906 [Bradyrhizobium sp. JR18.2]